MLINLTAQVRRDVTAPHWRTHGWIWLQARAHLHAPRRSGAASYRVKRRYRYRSGVSSPSSHLLLLLRGGAVAYVGHPRRAGRVRGCCSAVPLTAAPVPFPPPRSGSALLWFRWVGRGSSGPVLLRQLSELKEKKKTEESTPVERGPNTPPGNVRADTPLCDVEFPLSGAPPTPSTIILSAATQRRRRERPETVCLPQ